MSSSFRVDSTVTSGAFGVLEVLAVSVLVLRLVSALVSALAVLLFREALAVSGLVEACSRS